MLIGEVELLQFSVAEVVDDDAEVVELVDGDFEVTADGGFGGVGGLVGLLDGDDAAVGPGGLGDGGDGVAEGVGGDVELLAAGTDGAEHATDAEVGGVGVGEGDLELEHGGLDGEDGVLPAIEAVDGHEGAFGGRGDAVELLTLGFELDTLGVKLGSGGSGGGVGVAVTAGEDEKEGG